MSGLPQGCSEGRSASPDTYRVRQNESIKLVAVKMFVERPRQTIFSFQYDCERRNPFSPGCDENEAGDRAPATSPRMARVRRKMALSTPFAVKPTVGTSAIALGLIPCR